MDTFEIKDEEIDVEKIMGQIRENIRRRKEAGAYQDDLPAASVTPASGETDISRDLACLNNTSDIQNTSYFISSHRPFTGKFLVKGRELVHGEVRRYVDPVIWKQSEFNGSAARVLNDMNGRLGDLESQIQPEGAFVKTLKEGVARQILDVLDQIRGEIRGEVGGQISSVQRQTETEVQEIVAGMKADIKAMMKECLRREDEEIRAEISSLRGENKITMGDAVSRMKAEVDPLVEEKVRERLAAMDADIRDRAGLAHVLEQRISNASREGAKISGASESPGGAGLNYFVFEERFRGSRQEIKGRQEAFLPYFEGCKNVLDIGCGRGEFLELMREHGVGARGVDIDDTMVGYCRSRGLVVEKNDAVPYLEQIEDSSLDGVFIDQVVEHLEVAYFIKLLHLVYEKMMREGYVIVETVNILNPGALSNFYIDPTHIWPVHPDLLKFLVDQAGFRESTIVFKNYDESGDLSNIRFTAADYAVIAKK